MFWSYFLFHIVKVLFHLWEHNNYRENICISLHKKLNICNHISVSKIIFYNLVIHKTQNVEICTRFNNVNTFHNPGQSYWEIVSNWTQTVMLPRTNFHQFLVIVKLRIHRVMWFHALKLYVAKLVLILFNK